MTTIVPEFKHHSVIIIALSIILSCYSPGGAMAQLSADLLARKGDTLNLATQLDIIQLRYKKETDALSGSNRKYTAAIYKERFEGIKKMFDKGEMESNAHANEYLQAITNKIVQANPALAAISPMGYFSKSNVPNASSIGFGVFEVNAGLMGSLTNESQLAFVIAHELSHIYLRHAEKSIDKYITTLYSDEVQEELRNIRKQEFHKREALEKLTKGFSFDNRRHSRDHEQEADSMALVFLQNTGYQLKESLSTLGILDTIDNVKYHTDEIIPATFNCSEYPFKKKWLAKEEGLLGGHAVLEKDKELEDSLKTHPDCSIRIKALQPAVARNDRATNQTNPVNIANFNALKQWLPYESLDYYHRNESYCLEIFFALQMIKDGQDDKKAVLSIGNAFNALSAAQKKHQMGKVVQQPSPDNNTDYNTLLQFINNLYADELVSINYYFLKKYQPKLSDDKDYQTALVTSKQNL